MGELIPKLSFKAVIAEMRAKFFVNFGFVIILINYWVNRVCHQFYNYHLKVYLLLGIVFYLLLVLTLVLLFN